MRKRKRYRGVPHKDIVSTLSSGDWQCSRDESVGKDTVLTWVNLRCAGAIIMASIKGVEIGGNGFTLIDDLGDLNEYHMLLNLALVQVDKIRRNDPDMR